MKALKCKTLGANTAYRAYHANAHAWKLATPRVVVERVVLSLSVLALVSFPDPTCSRPEEGLVITSGFLVVLSQHAYGNFLMLRDSHMTAVVYSELLARLHGKTPTSSLLGE